jgi:hypothetical protein
MTPGDLRWLKGQIERAHAQGRVAGRLEGMTWALHEVTRQVTTAPMGADTSLLRGVGSALIAESERVRRPIGQPGWSSQASAWPEVNVT